MKQENINMWNSQVMQSMHVCMSGGCGGTQPPRNRNEPGEYMWNAQVVQSMHVQVYVVYALFLLYVLVKMS